MHRCCCGVSAGCLMLLSCLEFAYGRHCMKSTVSYELFKSNVHEFPRNKRLIQEQSRFNEMREEKENRRNLT